MLDETFQKDDNVRFMRTEGYSHLVKEGEIVKVLNYDPEYYDPDTASGFTWPAYVTVETAKGKLFHCHASRVTKDGVQQ